MNVLPYFCCLSYGHCSSFQCLAYFKKTDKITLNLLLIEVWFCFQNVFPMYLCCLENTRRRFERQKIQPKGRALLKMKFSSLEHIVCTFRHRIAENPHFQRAFELYSLNYIEMVVVHTHAHTYNHF